MLFEYTIQGTCKADSLKDAVEWLDLNGGPNQLRLEVREISLARGLIDVERPPVGWIEEQISPEPDAETTQAEPTPESTQTKAEAPKPTQTKAEPAKATVTQHPSTTVARKDFNAKFEELVKLIGPDDAKSYLKGLAGTASLQLIKPAQRNQLYTTLCKRIEEVNAAAEAKRSATETEPEQSADATTDTESTPTNDTPITFEQLAQQFMNTFRPAPERAEALWQHTGVNQLSDIPEADWPAIHTWLQAYQLEMQASA